MTKLKSVRLNANQRHALYGGVPACFMYGVQHRVGRVAELFRVTPEHFRRFIR